MADSTIEPVWILPRKQRAVVSAREAAAALHCTLEVYNRKGELQWVREYRPD